MRRQNGRRDESSGGSSSIYSGIDHGIIRRRKSDMRAEIAAAGAAAAVTAWDMGAVTGTATG